MATFEHAAENIYQYQFQYRNIILTQCSKMVIVTNWETSGILANKHHLMQMIDNGTIVSTAALQLCDSGVD